jgi:hypothetical protein
VKSRMSFSNASELLLLKAGNVWGSVKTPKNHSIGRYDIEKVNVLRLHLSSRRFVLFFCLTAVILSITQIVGAILLQEVPIVRDETDAYPNIMEEEASVFTFASPKGFKRLHFQITANGGTADGRLSEYCSGTSCRIPLIFGGNQTLAIVDGNKTISEENIESGPNRFHCINGGWERRICRFRDICFDNDNLTFVSPYRITSTVPFIVLGARPPPYDRKRDRQYFLKVNVSKHPPERITHDETTFYVSPYYNVQMMWHLFFDFILPLFHTTTIFGLNGKFPGIIIPKHADIPHSDVLNAFAGSFGKVKNGHCYRDLIVGMSKVKDTETGKDYEFPKNFTHLLYPLIMKYFKIKEIRPIKPLILFIGRRTSKRTIVNFEAVLDHLRAETSLAEFDVQPIFFEDMPMKMQIEAAHNATIMIGVHGSGLAHVAWMRPGTVLIEVFPHHFDCRDWYEKGSAVSGVKYLKYLSSESESANPGNAARRCWKQENGCVGDCLDALRDQDIMLNLTEFVRFVKAAAEDLGLK